MPIRREAVYSGDRELRWTSRRFGDDFRELRLRAGATQADVAEAIGVDRSAITRLERGDTDVSSTIRARACACLGADFRVHLYHERSPLLFDAASARVIERFLGICHRTWHPTVEARVPGPGRRSVDIRLERRGDTVIVEVETRVRRLEEVIRELHAKREAFAVEQPRRRVHVVLVLPPTRNHLALSRTFGSLVGTAFPAKRHDLEAALASPTLAWPGDGVIWIAGS
jgi:transcriptional regulator with XRE-family HTH domain